MATTTMTMAKALNEGLRQAMEKNKKVLLMGEDIGKLGGVFRITDGLQKDFGEDRVIDSPLGRVGDRRHGRRPRDPRATARCARSSSTASCTRPSTRSSARSPSCTSAPTACTRWRSSFASRSRAASARSSTTPRAPRPTSPRPRASRRGLFYPERRLLDDPGGDRARRPGHLL